MALISDQTIIEVKRSIDIVEVIQAYFPLKRAGANYRALCPFHDEKTASFNVHPEKQIFKCFGCGKAGDAISFVMEHEKVEYPEAILILAHKAGIAIQYQAGAAEGVIGREELYKANEWASGVFRQQLLKAPEAETARQFLARRGVSDETAETFGLGYAPESWDFILQRGRRNGMSDKILAAAGLVREKESRCFDFFRHRVMFPICDTRGKAIAFGARQLRDEDHPKFLNSPESALFSKGRGFYGLHLSREALEATRTVYIVEGYLDVIVPWQAGVRGLVATLGTALTRDHLKILRRYADKVVLVFDSDAAGQKASERGLDMLLSENVDIFVAELPAGLDPDDVVVKHGPERLRACLEKPREIFDFLIASLTKKHGGETPAAAQRIVEEMLERLALVPDEVKREILLQQLARRFNLEDRLLRGRLARATEAPATAAPPAGPVPPALEIAARDLLALAMADPAMAAEVRKITMDHWPAGILRKLAEAANALFDRTGAVDGNDLLALARDPGAAQTGAEVRAISIDPGDRPARLRGGLDTLARVGAKNESSDRLGRLKNASPEEEERILREALEAARRRPEDRSRMPGRHRT